jgi:formylglycine-generating enzyme required for sulfatase activity
MRARFVRSSIFISAIIVCVGLLSFHSSIEGTTSAQDPNATLPTPKKTAPAKKTTPPKKPTRTTRSTAPANNRGQTNNTAKTDESAADERSYWESIRLSSDPEDFKAYLQKYPNGQYVDLARNSLRRLEAAKNNANTNTAGSPSGGISLGTIPSYDESSDGVKLDGVRDNSPAARAGLRAGDKIVRMAGQDVRNLNDYTSALGKMRAGQEYEVEVVRGGQRLTLKVTPTAREPSSTPATLPRTHTNQAGIEFVLIPPGSFMMGSTNGEDNEKPVHQVTISQAFYMGKYEVTQGQWQSVMGNNPSLFKDCGGNCPVEQVSWDDAQSFINKLNESNDGFRYRLPTEAEWEYACRAGTTGDYAGTLSEMAWYSENSGGKTHAVGGKQPNAWGLADMHGNVWEWCQDGYHETYYAAPTDGSAWLSGGEQKYRVLRGGSWGFVANGTRSAGRNGYFSPVYRNGNIGFRVVAVR